MVNQEITPGFITVEFLGIPKLKAGVSFCKVPAGSLSSIIDYLKNQFPRLSQEFLPSPSGKSHVLYSLNGDYFLHDPEMILLEGQQLLIISADAGG
ncbi:MAG: MoaD/ThiS family protein [Gemmataceae bacterium]|nr:MoaD/ThiS family protein [Gemmataceae bacterium]MBJ7431876.1 MoaD/ThiS family protein [Gemmataceae bacterium]